MLNRLNWPQVCLVAACLGAAIAMGALHLELPGWTLGIITLILGPMAILQPKDPRLPLGLVTLIAFAAASSACGGAVQGMPTQADFGAYAAAQAVCVQWQDTKAATIACIADERRKFCTKFPGVCGGDGGIEQ